MDIEAFGQRLKELRNGRSQTDIVKLIFEKTGLSITAQTFGRYENGKRKPDIEIIEALANTFDVSADYLLCRSDVKSTDINMKAMCKYTGLSEKAIVNISKDKPLNEAYHSDISYFLENDKIIDLIIEFQNYFSNFSEYSDWSDRLNNLQDEIQELEHEDDYENKEEIQKLKKELQKVWDEQAFQIWKIEHKVKEFVKDYLLR